VPILSERPQAILKALPLPWKGDRETVWQLGQPQLKFDAHRKNQLDESGLTLPRLQSPELGRKLNFVSKDSVGRADALSPYAVPRISDDFRGVTVSPLLIPLSLANIDGYKAVQLGFEEIGEARAKKVVNNPRRGQFKKYGKPVFRYVKEVRVDNVEAFGDEVTVNIFDGIAKVDVIGTSKGKGFQGTMKRHNFGGGPRSHGSKVHRRPASTGTTQMGSLPGMRKPGQMGNARVTALGLTVVRLDAERNLLLVKGSVPGPNGRLITVRESGRK
jgi:large subunit ribosomal protein L3